MVRVVSNGFNHPRSRHSSGETDLDLAQRADSALALSTLRGKRLDILDCESSSDSFWDSEFDADHQDQNMCLRLSAEDELNGNTVAGKSEVHTKRKERRRERNKVSAQAYRQRKRQDNCTVHQELSILEEKNRRLKQQVTDLEAQTEQAKKFLIESFSTTSIQSPSLPLSPHMVNDQQINGASPISSPCLSTATTSPVPNNLNSNLYSQHFFSEQVPLRQQDHQIGNDNINLNIPQVTTVHLNHLDSPHSSPSMSPCHDSFQSAKPKQPVFNTNHCYRVPIHQHKVLHTVPEIPSNIPDSEEEIVNNFTYRESQAHVFNVNLNASQCSINNMKTDSKEMSCDNPPTNHKIKRNMNLNINERMRAGSAYENKEQIWNGSYPNANIMSVGNLNDNDKRDFNLNSNVNSNKQNALQNSNSNANHVYINPNNHVRLIFATVNNELLPQ